MGDDQPNLGYCDLYHKIAYDLWVNDEVLTLSACRHHALEWQLTLHALGFWLIAAKKVPA